MSFNFVAKAVIEAQRSTSIRFRLAFGQRAGCAFFPHGDQPLENLKESDFFTFLPSNGPVISTNLGRSSSRMLVIAVKLLRAVS